MLLYLVAQLLMRNVKCDISANTSGLLHFSSGITLTKQHYLLNTMQLDIVSYNIAFVAAAIHGCSGSGVRKQQVCKRQLLSNSFDTRPPTHSLSV
uniref:Putative secreted protein ovary overexpressed n=1 Tax=Rhipicephalus microplus TaxID=6941 RepID=A0A6M2DA07_RHIMP